MTELIGKQRLAEALEELPDWEGSEQQIHRVVQAPTFLAGIDLVSAVGSAAEEMDHHPDIDIRWRTITFRLSTHSEGGVTDKDLVLARQIDGLVAEVGS